MSTLALSTAATLLRFSPVAIAIFAPRVRWVVALVKPPLVQIRLLIGTPAIWPIHA
jgi:hypothetical protein